MILAQSPRADVALVAHYDSPPFIVIIVDAVVFTKMAN